MKPSLRKYFSIVCLLFAFFLVSPDAFAGTELHVLFNPDGSQNPAYTIIVDELQQGDVLRFSNGNEFPVLEVLGNGTTTKIVRISEDKALRIPLAMGDYHYFGETLFYTTPYKDFIDGFWWGQRNIKRFGVDVVGASNYLSGEYVIVDYLPIQFTLYDLLTMESLEPYGYAKEDLLNDLYKWAKTTHNLVFIQDFKADQIGYTGSQWILFDFGRVTQSLSSFMRVKDIHYPQVPIETIFTNDRFLPTVKQTPIFREDEVNTMRQELLKSIIYERFKRRDRLCPLKDSQ